MSAGGRARSNTNKVASKSMFLVVVIAVVKIGVNANNLEPW